MRLEKRINIGKQSGKHSGQVLNTRLVPLLIVAVAFFNGLIYLILIPPWQHYDEPNHFEFAWLIADRGKLPAPGAYDTEMRRQVSQSMIVHGFFRNMGFTPDLNSKKPYIGTYDQTNGAPLYYLLSAAVLKLFHGVDIDTQMYALRMMSLGFGLLTVFFFFLFAKALTHEKSTLRILVPLFVALLPGFADIMTSVNSDVLATFVFSCFLWGMVRCLRRGFRIIDVSITFFFSILGIFVRNSLIVSLPVFLLVFLIWFVREKSWRHWAYGGLLVLSIVGVGMMISTGDAAYWYRGTKQEERTTRTVSETPIGKKALVLSSPVETTPTWLPAISQPIPPDVSKDVAGKQFTFGAWMWADAPVTIQTPVIHYGDKTFSRNVELTSKPAFYTFHFRLQRRKERIWLTYNPLSAISQPNHIYLDGVVLTAGHYSSGHPPVFDDTDAQAGTWEGKPFVNIIRNGSFEHEWFYVRPYIDDCVQKLMPDNIRLSSMLATAMDYSGSGWYYQLTAARLFRTFWATFGWGHVPLLGHKPYRVLLAFTILVLIGLVVSLVREWKRLPWMTLIVFGIVLTSFWVPILVRGSVFIVFSHVFLPVARYGLPTIAILSIGIVYGLSVFLRSLGARDRNQVVMLVSLLVLLNLWSVISIFSYYYL